MLTAVLLPPVPNGTRSVFLKQGEKSFDWSIADVAVVLDCAPDGRCRRASVVLGAAAPVPWRAPQAEAALAGQTIDATVAHAAGQAAIAGAVPLSSQRLQAADPGDPGAPCRAASRCCNQSGDCAMTTRRDINLGTCSPRRASSMAPRFASAQEQAPIALPPPRADFGCSLAQALKLRRSTREFAARPLPPQVLSRAVVVRLRHQPPGHRGPHRAVVPPCARDRDFRRDGGRGLALRSDRASAGAASRRGCARRRPAYRISPPPRRSTWSTSPTRST